MAIAVETTDDRPTCVGTGFGRVFYGLASTVYFSQLIEGSGNLGKCYQANDPTSENFNELLDTDGGTVKIEDSDDVNALLRYGKGIMVFARNGVWFIRGNDSGFTATSFSVDRINEAPGCINPQSIVEGRGSLFYWTDSGIERIFTDEFGNVLSENFTDDTIRNFYLSIPDTSKKDAVGSYDKNKQQLGWLYSLSSVTDTNVFDAELIYDIKVGAWYPQEYAVSSSWKLAGNFTLDLSTSAEIKRYIVRDNSENYAVGSLEGEDFKDFENDIPTGFLETGYETLGSSGNKKSATYAVIQLRRTEDGFDSDYTPTNQSSCLFQAKWDWSDSNAGGRWSPKQQAYRYNRVYMPTDTSDPYDTGELIIETKNKVMGSGTSVSFRFETEEGKDLQLYGYSVEFSMTGRV